MPHWNTIPSSPFEALFGYMFLATLAFVVVSCPSVQETFARSTDGVSGEELLPGIPVQEDSTPDEPDTSTDGDGSDAADSELREDVRLGTEVPLEGVPLEAFFRSLSESEEEKDGLVRILHYGDSHTAADFLTTEVRRILQDRFGDGGRGFVLMGRPWRSYLPKDVKVESVGNWSMERVKVAVDPATLDGYYGLSGISVTADDSTARMTISTEKGSGYGETASVFEVFYLSQRNGGSFSVSVDGVLKGTVDTASRKMRSGFYRVKVDDGPHSFSVQARGNGPVRFFGAVIESDGPGIVYDTLGVNGGFFYTPHLWNPEELKKQIARRDPRLIVTMYGSNEVDSKSIDPKSYKADVQSSLERFRAGAPFASCLLLGPPDRVPRTIRGQGDQLSWIIDVQREVASEAGCGFMDLRDMMGGPGAHVKWQRMRPSLAQPDGVHLTVRGYRILGEQIAHRLIQAYEEYRAGL